MDNKELLKEFEEFEKSLIRQESQPVLTRKPPKLSPQKMTRNINTHSTQLVPNTFSALKSGYHQTNRKEDLERNKENIPNSNNNVQRGKRPGSCSNKPKKNSSNPIDLSQNLSSQISFFKEPKKHQDNPFVFRKKLNQSIQSSPNVKGNHNQKYNDDEAPKDSYMKQTFNQDQEIHEFSINQKDRNGILNIEREKTDRQLIDESKNIFRDSTLNFKQSGNKQLKKSEKLDNKQEQKVGGNKEGSVYKQCDETSSLDDSVNIPDDDFSNVPSVQLKRINSKSSMNPSDHMSSLLGKSNQASTKQMVPLLNIQSISTQRARGAPQFSTNRSNMQSTSRDRFPQHSYSISQSTSSTYRRPNSGRGNRNECQKLADHLNSQQTKQNQLKNKIEMLKNMQKSDTNSISLQYELINLVSTLKKKKTQITNDIESLYFSSKNLVKENKKLKEQKVKKAEELEKLFQKNKMARYLNQRLPDKQKKLIDIKNTINESKRDQELERHHFQKAADDKFRATCEKKAIEAIFQKASQLGGEFNVELDRIKSLKEQIKFLR